MDRRVDGSPIRGELNRQPGGAARPLAAVRHAARRRVHAEVPGADQTDETWLRWFQQFERLLQPLQRISDELERTVEAMRS